MASFDPSFPHTLAAEPFQRLRHSLEQLHNLNLLSQDDAGPPDTILLTEAALGIGEAMSNHIDYFSLVVSPSFAILLIAQLGAGRDRQDEAVAFGDHPTAADRSRLRPLSYGVNLITSSQAVTQFIDWLTQQFPRTQSNSHLQAARQAIGAAEASDEQRWTALLLAALPRANWTAKASSSEPPASAGLPSAAPVSAKAESLATHAGTGLQHHRSLSDPASSPSATKAENAKNVFLAMVNHELRTPLTYILGMSTTLLRWIDGGATVALQRQQRHYLESIYNQGKHLLELINGILDLSQSELGQITLNMQPVALSKLIQQCIRAYRGEAHRRGINLIFETHTRSNQDRIAADPLRIQQIIVNLLNNAIKFTPPGGQITVRLSLTNTEAVIEVQDTGIGIAEDDQAVIFQKFKQVDESYHRQYAGIGTGLSLAKQLAELHQGDIEVSSTLGVGTTFSVRLPYTACVTAPIPETAGGRSSIFGERVLLISEDSETAEVIADGVLTAGYPLLWMLDKPKSAKAILDLQPTCLILGNCSANREGRSLIQQLRQQPEGERLQIIAIAEDPEALAQYHHSVGIAATLTTPIDLTALLDNLWSDS